MKVTKTEIFALVVIILVGLSMAGCSYQPAINAAEKMGIQAAEAANDNILEMNQIALCSLPYRTFLRHPETWAWANQLCAPGAKEATPNTMLKGPSTFPPLDTSNSVK